MNWVSAFLGVIAIIGIIMVGGFVIFFLGDIVLSVLDPNYVRFGRGHKKDRSKEFSNINEDVAIKEIEGVRETKEIEYKPSFAKEETKAAVVEEGIDDHFFDDVKEAKREIELEEGKAQDFNALRAEEEQFRANMLKAIEERRAKRTEEQQKDIDFDKFFFGDEDIDVFGNDDETEIIENNTEAEEINTDAEILEEEIKADAEEIVEEEVEEVEEVEEIEEEVKKLEAVVETIKVDTTELDALRKKYEEELSKLELENSEIKKEKEKLERESVDAKEEIAKLVEEKLNISRDLEETAANCEPKGSLTISEYEAQLAKLKERLTENEKDLRKVKKEFIPLRRVHNTLENDEKKLRRREAIVAKQKVELYGVNNIVDLDQEKAKKLTEDLDLLEGLKLSVKHCEEVMAANKDRYPILENTFKILTNTNKTIREDMDEIEGKIATLKTEEE